MYGYVNLHTRQNIRSCGSIILQKTFNSLVLLSEEFLFNQWHDFIATETIQLKPSSMRNQNTITQKLSEQNQLIADQDRDINGRIISFKSKNSFNSDLTKGESKLSPKESYNGGSTYGEHQ